MAITTFAPLARYLESIYPADSDEVLLKRFARSADEAAFTEIVRRHGPAVLGVCRRILRDGHAAEDAFQVVFLLLAKKADSLRNPERLACWLHGVAFRTALKQRSWLMRRRLREQPIEETTLAAAKDPDSDIRFEIDAAIQQLPAKYRMAIVLCYMQGLTNAQAAAALGCPPNTIATRLARARGRLKERLTKQGLTVAVSSSLAAATAHSAAGMMSGVHALSSEIITLMEGVRIAMFLKKIKFVAAVVAIATITGVGANRLAFRAAAEQPQTADATAQQSPAQQSAVQRTPAVPATIPTAPSSEERIPAINLASSATESRNFVVVGNITQQTGFRIEQAAEQYRREFARIWLGKELPTWTKLCPINVNIREDGGSGATSFSFDPRFQIQAMHLTGTLSSILDCQLPHEVTHAVIADGFRRPIPRWADEGIAITNENSNSQIRHAHMCRLILSEGRALRLKSFFETTDYLKDTMVTYAEGYSVVRFLIGLKGRAPVLEFVKSGMKDGWEFAAKHWYEFDSLDAMEKAWIDSLGRPAEDAPTKPDADVAIPPPPPPVEVGTPQQTPAQVAPIPASAQPDQPSAPAVAASPPPASQAPAPPPTIPAASPNQMPDWRQSKTPIVIVDAAIEGQQLVVKFPKSTFVVPITSYRQVGGKAQAMTSYVRRYLQEEHRYQIKLVEVFGVNGKQLDEKELAARLAKETQAIYVENRNYDPRLLSLLKPDTLIISVNEMLPPAPPMPSVPAVSSVK